jgi:small subunit ribosomal protein S13
MFIYKQKTLNLNKNIINSLQYIYGIGWYKSSLITSKMGLSFLLAFKNLNFFTLQLLSFILDFFTWLEIRIKRYIYQNIKMQFEILSYVGIRHKDSLPVRGQRTRTMLQLKKDIK